jgi:hypothetical protein|tara:strand:- start:140 stop:874 length:735 start_codon:yes stop_codon:yes gene_type:complete
MALPKIETPTYELTLPSQDIKVKYRPFLVKEEKILLMALESQKSDEIFQATKQIVSSCTFNALKVEELPTFDLEYIFLQIRAKSVGETTKFKVLCPDDKKTYADVEVDLTKVNVEVDDKHTNKLVVDEKRNLGVVLKYPTMNVLKSGTMENPTTEQIFDVLTECVDHIYEGDKIYPAKDSTPQEIKEFFEDLSQDSFVKIKNFFDTMPRLRHEVEVTNPVTNVKSKVVLSGLNDFFESASPTTA